MQEAVVIAANIFRRFPTKYEKLISLLVEKIEHYTEPESKAAIAWILGEYAEKIDDSVKHIEAFIENFLEEADNVKLSLLTATVKLYLKKPDESEDLIHNILTIATEKADNPDLKDRAYIYWRMLSADPQKTQDVVLCKKPQIAHDTYNLYDEELVDQLIDQISNLCSIYHKTGEEWRDIQSKYERKPAPQGVEEVKQPEVVEDKSKEKSSKRKTKPAKKMPSDDEEDEDEKEKEKEKSKAAKKSKKESKKKKKDSSGDEEEKKEDDNVKKVEPVQQTGSLIDIDDMLSAPASKQPSSGLEGMDLGGVNFGQSPAPATQMNTGNNDGGFGFFDDNNNNNNNQEDDWAADAFGDSGTTSLPLDFAKAPMTEVLPARQASNKGESGLKVDAHFFLDESFNIRIGLEMTNLTGKTLQ